MSWRARFSPNVFSCVIFLNPKDPNCFGVRNWWRNNLPELQLLNPGTNFNVQELTFGEPHMFVSYSSTDQRVVRLAGATEDETEDIMESISTYGNTHALLERARDDSDPSENVLITNFGYAESFMSRLEVGPLCPVGQQHTDGVDDAGQRGRVLPRNNALKFVP